MDRDRVMHETTSACTAYTDQTDGYANVTHEVGAGFPLLAAINDNQTRTLDNGKVVQVIRFTEAGRYSWCWMPRDEFLRSTKKI